VEVKIMKNIVETAIEAGTFRTLVEAVKTAGLVKTLSGRGPFTVFAPNDSAFAKLPSGTLEKLLRNKEKLTSVLTHHVVPGKVMATDVMKIRSAKTVQGQNVSIDTTKGVKISGANVIKTNI